MKSRHLDRWIAVCKLLLLELWVNFWAYIFGTTFGSRWQSDFRLVSRALYRSCIIHIHSPITNANFCENTRVRIALNPRFHHTTLIAHTGSFRCFIQAPKESIEDPLWGSFSVCSGYCIFSRSSKCVWLLGENLILWVFDIKFYGFLNVYIF